MFSTSMTANALLQRSFDENIEVSLMKLQRLLYLSTVEYMRVTGKPLLEEQFQTWQYGPVLSSAYDQFSSFKGKPIRKYAKNAQGQSLALMTREYPHAETSLDKVWHTGKLLTAVELSRITTSSDSGWYRAYTRGDKYILDQDIAYEVSRA